METIRITNPNLDLDFQFDVQPGTELSNKYLFDIMKENEVVSQGQLLDAWSNPKNTETDRDFIREAFEADFFSNPEEGNFVDAFFEGSSILAEGVFDIRSMNQANAKYNKFLGGLGIAKKDYEGTHYETDDYIPLKQKDRFSFGKMPRQERNKIDKTALRFFNFFKESQTSETIGSNAMEFLQGDFDAFSEKEINPEKFKGFVKHLMRQDNLNYQDEELVNEVIRRGGEIGRAQENINFYQGLQEWAGGYSMLGNWVEKMAGKGELFVQNADNRKQEVDIELNYLAKNNKYAKGMQDGAMDVAMFMDDKLAENALKNNLLEAEPDSAMVYSFAPDIPVEIATGGTAMVAQMGMHGFRRGAMKGQLLTLKSELDNVLLEINEKQVAKDFVEEGGVLKGELDADNFVRLQKTNKLKAEKIDRDISSLQQKKKVILDKYNDLTNSFSNPSVFRSGIGQGMRATGVTSDFLGRTLEAVRRLPREALIDGVMKFGKSAEDAQRIADQILIVGTGSIATGVGVLASTDEQFRSDLKDILPYLATLIGPEVLQKTGTTLRHLGDHYIANHSTKTPFAKFQQLNTKNPKFSDVIIDRTEGASFINNTLPAVSRIFKRGETGNFMGKQGISRPERFLARTAVDLGADKAMGFASRTLMSATTASTLPVAFGYAMGGEEGAGIALGASAPFITLGVGAGEVIRHSSKAMADVKQRGDIANHRKNLSDEQSNFFDELSHANQAGLASAQIAFPDAEVRLINDPKSSADGYHEIKNGRSIIVVNVKATQPLLPVLAHEIGHHIKAHGLTPLIHDIMFGSPFKNKGGIFSKYDMEKGEYVKESVDGVDRYQTNELFEEYRTKYLKRLEDARGDGIDELTRRQYNTQEFMADEIFAEYVAQHILTNKSRDYHSGMLRSLFGAMSGKPFLKKAGLNMGLFSHSEDNLLFNSLPDSPELNAIIEDYQRSRGRLSQEEMAELYPLSDRDENGEYDVIITPAEQIANPELMEAFNTGGIFKTDENGNILKGIGGSPKLMTKKEVEKQQAKMANELLSALENSGNDLPDGHVVLNENGSASGFFLSGSIIDNLKGYNASQINFLRQMNNVGRLMASGQVDFNKIGNQAIMFYFSAMKHGGKFYKTLRGGYRNMLFYGMEVSKDQNIYFRTISLDQMDQNINWFMKSEKFGEQIVQEFGGTSFDETRKIISTKYDTYFSNQAKGILNGKDGSGITEKQKDFLNAFLGNTGSGNVDSNPILTSIGSKQAEKITAIRSRRLDRIGSIEFPGGGQPVRIRKVINNLMPAKRKNPNQTEMDFSDTQVIEKEDPYPIKVNFYKFHGINPNDPQRINKVADVLIAEGNRWMDPDIARDNHEAFGISYNAMLNALDKAHTRDEYRNSRNRKYMPANLGLKDNIVDQVLPAINQEKFSGEQFNSAIGKVAGAKAYADDIGLTGFLEGKKSVTKTDIEDFVAENHLKLDSYDLADQTKYNRSSLVTPGERTNYNETLVEFEGGGRFTKNYESDASVHEGKVKFENEEDAYGFLDAIREEGIEDMGADLGDYTVSFKAIGDDFDKIERFEVDFMGEMQDHTFVEQTISKTTLPTFKNKHWDSDKVIGHIRRTDRIIDGKDTRFLEEMQSDWLQALRRWKKWENMTPEQRTKFLKKNKPPAPVSDVAFEKNWPALLLKKAMMDAINDGKTHIAWADGKVHNDRYSLTRTLDDITMEPQYGQYGAKFGIRELYLNTKEQGIIQLQVDGKGRVLETDNNKVHSDHEGFVGKGLDEIIGKQMADKILEEPSWDDALKRKKLNALDQEIDKYKEFAEEFITGKFKPFRYDNSKYSDFKQNGKFSDLSPALQNEYKKWKGDNGFRDLDLMVGRGNLTDFIVGKILELQRQQDIVYDGIVVYEGKDLDISDPALPNFYDKEVVKVATKLAKKLGVGKPEKVNSSSIFKEKKIKTYANTPKTSSGAWMMELPTKQALSEQTLYMPGLGDDAIASPGLPLITQNYGDSVKRKYSKIRNTELSAMVAKAQMDLDELGGPGEMGEPSVLTERNRRVAERNYNELAGEESRRFMPPHLRRAMKEGKNLQVLQKADVELEKQALKDWKTLGFESPYFQEFLTKDFAEDPVFANFSNGYWKPIELYHTGRLGSGDSVNSIASAITRKTGNAYGSQAWTPMDSINLTLDRKFAYKKENRHEGLKPAVVATNARYIFDINNPDHLNSLQQFMSQKGDKIVEPETNRLVNDPSVLEPQVEIQPAVIEKAPSDLPKNDYSLHEWRKELKEQGWHGYTYSEKGADNLVIFDSERVKLIENQQGETKFFSKDRNYGKVSGLFGARKPSSQGIKFTGNKDVRFMPSLYKHRAEFDKNFTRSSKVQNFLKANGTPVYAKQEDGYLKPEIFYHGGTIGTPGSTFKFGKGGKYDNTTFFLSKDRSFSQDFNDLHSRRGSSQPGDGSNPIEVITNVSKIWSHKDPSHVKMLVDFLKTYDRKSDLIDPKVIELSLRDLTNQIQEGDWRVIEELEHVIKMNGFQGYAIRQAPMVFEFYNPARIMVDNIALFDSRNVKLIQDSPTGRPGMYVEGSFTPGNPDIRFMPLLNLPGDKSVQYKKTKNVTKVKFDDATRLAGKKFTLLEADRQDTDGGNMGGPLFPFLKSNDIVITEGGNKYRLMWANLTSDMVHGTMDRVGMTDDGHAFIQIMQEEAHRSNKVMFGNILNSFETNKKNMSPLEIEVLANVIYFLRERKVNTETWNPSAEQKDFFAKDIKNYKTNLSKGNTAKANQILVDAKAKYGQTDWWNSNEVKSYMADFNNAFTHKSFEARADISSYFIPKPKKDGTLGAKLPFVPDLKKLLKGNADYQGAKTGDAIGVVQLSKHKLDTFEGKTRVKNEDRVFAIYTGNDPAEIAFMSSAEKRILKKLQGNPKFKAHKAYDWIMLGPAKGDRFQLNRPLNIVNMMDKSAYTKNHLSVWKGKLLKMQNDAVRRYGSTTMRTGLDLKNKKDKKEHDFFVKLDKFSKKKPLDKQPESNIIGAILRGKDAGAPALSKFMQDLK